MKKIVVCGAGGAGRETIDMLESMNLDSRWKIVGFSDAAAFEGQKVRGYPVMSEDDLLGYPEPIDAVISVGSPSLREKIFTKLSKNPNVSFPAIVHPSSRVARGVVLPDAVLITGFCSVSPDASIGKGVFLNGYCIVSHDAKIGDFSALMAFSLVTGNVNIGKGVFMGASSVVVQGLSVGENAELCAGSVVVRDVKSGAKMMGNPARAIA
jgi:sugar O-acyltransferase (sialic acid O-acetyltransferase NeuD family)